MGLEETLKNLESKYKTQNKPVEENIEISDSKSEKDNLSQPEQDNKPKMTQEQANAVMNVAKNTDDFVNLKISSKINDIIEEDDDVKKQVKDIAKSTVKTSIQTIDTKNQKQEKRNYFDLNERDIVPLGADRTSPKAQQMTIVSVRRIFWVIFMATLGLYLIPSTVLIELFQNLTYRKVEEQVVSGEKKMVISKYKLGPVGIVAGCIFALAWCAGLVYLTILFTIPMLIVSACFLFIIIAIHIYTSFTSKSKIRKENVTTINKNVETEIEE